MSCFFRTYGNRRPGRQEKQKRDKIMRSDFRALLFPEIYAS